MVRDRPAPRIDAIVGGIVAGNCTAAAAAAVVVVFRRIIYIGFWFLTSIAATGDAARYGMAWHDESVSRTAHADDMIGLRFYFGNVLSLTCESFRIISSMGGRPRATVESSEWRSSDTKVQATTTTTKTTTTKTTTNCCTPQR